MRFLEARVPAPIVALGAGGAMWLVSGNASLPDSGARVREVVVTVALQLSAGPCHCHICRIVKAGDHFQPSQS